MKIDDFLNPKSMLTPAVAGSIIMLISNTLWLQFSISPKWSALVLSFVFVVPILIKYSATFLEKCVYFTFNGLIIFSLAVNTNFAGKKISDVVSVKPTTQQASEQYVRTSYETPSEMSAAEKLAAKLAEDRSSKKTSSGRPFFKAWF